MNKIIQKSLQIASFNNIVYYTNKCNKQLMTFDDSIGVDPIGVLSVLNKYNVSSIFFLTGEYIMLNQAVVKQAVSDGHKIYNHSMNHDNFNELSYREIVISIKSTQKLIEKIAKSNDRIIRPPYGILNLKVIFACLLNKFKIMMWSSRGYEFAGLNKHQLLQNYLSQTTKCNNQIILMHPNMAESYEILEQLIIHKINEGIEFAHPEEIYGK
ncbi:polysaccharide deacetylase family protein [Geobacter sulfurreducens]|uniref:polysaccharide deacetylase family protein n=1 Tax=Geobacter sulfurreducens TaxID=35554 RepID=UPI001BDD4F10|nr:polysaccharide deacetylase family protein [Geobacter sulfurreducens]QVW33906.1 polysaccharide deacetylase family protein [Geobacter sulfurreducens]